MVEAHRTAEVSTQQHSAQPGPLPALNITSQESPLMNAPSDNPVTARPTSLEHTPLCPGPVFVIVKQRALTHRFCSHKHF